MRGSFGLFYDRVPLRALANALLSTSGQATVSLSPGPDWRARFPAILPGDAVPPGILYNLTTMDPRMQNAYSAQGSFEFEQQLGSRSTLSVGVRAPARPASHRVDQPQRAGVRGIGE